MTKAKDFIDDSIKGLDEPFDSSGLTAFLKKGKMLCRIIYEDTSYIDYYKKFSASYIVTIKNKDYLVVPKCFLRGKFNCMIWYFNNPLPINFEYVQSKVTALSLLDEKKLKALTDEQRTILAKTTMDGEGLHSIFNTKLIKGLYPVDSMFTGKMLLIYGVVIFVVILVILQITGTVDVLGEFNKMIKGA